MRTADLADVSFHIAMMIECLTSAAGAMTMRTNARRSHLNSSTWRRDSPIRWTTQHTVTHCVRKVAETGCPLFPRLARVNQRAYDGVRASCVKAAIDTRDSLGSYCARKEHSLIMGRAQAGHSRLPVWQAHMHDRATPRALDTRYRTGTP